VIEHKTDAVQRQSIPTASAILDDGAIVELVHKPDCRRTFLCVFSAGRWTLTQRVEITPNIALVPFSADNNLIAHNVVLLPSEPRIYGTEAELILEVEGFIHRHVDLSPEFEKLAAHYVILTWLYDAFSELPYLRLRGDFGSGKTRALLTIGALCNKPFFASGASTVSPIFHTLDAFQGTLIFDEADFRFSDEKAELVKILNNGNVRGLPVLRTMMNRQREFNPQAFRVFGPKIVATRGSYDDRALESRFLTEVMGGRKLRRDIPINLPPSFYLEAQELRNKLLLYRFHRRFETKLDPSLFDPGLEARLNQILMPLLSVVSRPALRQQLRIVATAAQAELVAERGLLAEAQVLEVLSKLMAGSMRPAIPLAELVHKFVESFGPEYQRPITARWLGSILRKRLHLHPYKSHGVYVLPASEWAKVQLLCERYGITTAVQPSDPLQSGDVGTSGTS
jgi:hypothetical protein